MSQSSAKRIVPKPFKIVDLPDDQDASLMADSPRDIAVATCLSPQQVIQTYLQSGFHHIVQKSQSNFEKELEITQSMVLSPEAFLSHPVETLLPQATANPLYIPVFSSKSKGQFLQSLEKELSQIQGARSTIKSLLMIGDELYTNTIFNAPTAKGGAHKFKATNRDKHIKLGLHEQGKIFLGHSETEIVMGCQDPFGSLHPRKVLEGVARCYTIGTSASMNRGSGGAGIGFQLIFEHSTSLYVAVQSGVSTVICVKLPLGQGAKERDLSGKNLHVIHDGVIEDKTGGHDDTTDPDF